MSILTRPNHHGSMDPKTNANLYSDPNPDPKSGGKGREEAERGGTEFVLCPRNYYYNHLAVSFPGQPG